MTTIYTEHVTTESDSFWIAYPSHVLKYGHTQDRIAHSWGRGFTRDAAREAAEDALAKVMTKQIIMLTPEQQATLSEIFGDAIAYRTNSGEGADDEDDEATAARFESLAAQFGIEVTA